MEMITVGELINLLQAFDQDLPIVIKGYEGGFDYPLDPYEIEIVTDVNVESYYGAHDIPSDAKEKERAIRAIYLPRP